MEPRLHLLMTPGALADCLSQGAPVDAVVLLDRGAELLVDPGALASLQAVFVGVHVAVVDRRARGLPRPEGCADLDDASLVALVAGHPQVLSWT